MSHDKLNLLGYASGLAGADLHVSEGPAVIQQSPYMRETEDYYQWLAMIHPPAAGSLVDRISHACGELARQVSGLTRKQKAFCLLGGDHTSAIGTWSGVYDAIRTKGELGLIWIDAHMDSHTPETTLSGRIHGMPLACLMGYGYPALTNILQASPKLKPENVCLVGVRSFEAGEAALLAELNVRIYFIEEVKRRGLAVILNEAIQHVSQHTIGYGVSLDVDAIDPEEAPGVDVPAFNGLELANFISAFPEITHDPALLGIEIVEFDPYRDKDHRTEKIIISLLKMIHDGKKSWA